MLEGTRNSSHIHRLSWQLTNNSHCQNYLLLAQMYRMCVESRLWCCHTMFYANVINAQQIYEFEQKCLIALHQKLLIAQFAGKPFRALLMEYLLGGNGGELSEKISPKAELPCLKSLTFA